MSDPDDKFLLAAKKETVNYNKRVTGQSYKEQEFYLGPFFMKKF